MKTIGIRSLRENPGILSKSAAAGEYVLVTNRSRPISLSIPFDEDLLQTGVHVNLAVKLYEEQVLTLIKAAKLAKVPVEEFMNKLASLGVVSANQTAEELQSDLDSMSE